MSGPKIRKHFPYGIAEFNFTAGMVYTVNQSYKTLLDQSVVQQFTSPEDLETLRKAREILDKLGTELATMVESEVTRKR